MKQLLAAMLCATLSLSAKDVIVRTQLTPEEVWVGQRMQLQIDVLGKDGWAQIADLSELEVPGSYVRPAGNSRVRLNETIDGENYTGQRYELSIYPQRSGAQELPPIDLLVKVQTWGAQTQTKELTMQTEGIQFETLLPTGADPNLPVIVSSELKATQAWEPDRSEFEVGEALKRRIKLEASDLPAMVLPPLISDAASGVSAYLQSPELEDGTKSATRKEAVTYVFEHNIETSLPDYVIQWWNPETNELKQVTLEGRNLSVHGGAVEPAPIQEQPSSLTKIALTALTVGALSLICYSLYRFKKRQQQHAPQEPEVFKHLINASNQNNPIGVLNALIGWLGFIDQRPSLFFATYADTTTQSIASQLLSSPDNGVELDGFADGLKTARKRFLKAQRQPLSKADHMLPPLNH